MNALDVTILLIVALVAARGVASGFLRQAGSLGGFVLGLILGAALAPWAVSPLPANSSSRAFVALLVFFGVAVIVGGIGETIGYSLSGVAERYRLRVPDAILGAAFGIIIALITIWLLAATFARSSGPALAAEIQDSRILQSLDRSLPPAPDVMAELERTLGVDNIPRVFTGLEPSPAPPVTGPNAAAVNEAAAAGKAATVKIEGLGCGGLIDGSGFVVGKDLVATNAHVVAGIASPEVIDSRGRHDAEVVLFDPNLDFAVLRVRGLAETPLNLDGSLTGRGTVGAVLGYPGGGSFTISPAAILDEQTAVGRNIYDSGLISRQIYELQAVVRPGNSGGPLITPNGTVVGIVFAMSTTNGDVGYALTSSEVIPDLNAAKTHGQVGTGACVSD
ncbi:MAG TPA: MarP family serine protease [Candidatus Saccharimonadia bacterium]|nr:MarP family serine protease [Candidatus Saccharimonadia bacterium]